MTVDIEKLEALAKAATQGQWRKGKNADDVVADHPAGHEQDPHDIDYYGGHLVAESISASNREFIAAANPAAVLELLAEIERLKAQLATERLSGFSAAFYQIADAVGVTGARAATPEQVFNGEVMPAIEAFRKDAERYRWLRSRDVDTISKGGVFAGMTPQNLVINEETLDEAVDAAMSKETGQ